MGERNGAVKGSLGEKARRESDARELSRGRAWMAGDAELTKEAAELLSGVETGNYGGWAVTHLASQKMEPAKLASMLDEWAGHVRRMERPEREARDGESGLGHRQASSRRMADAFAQAWGAALRTDSEQETQSWTRDGALALSAAMSLGEAISGVALERPEREAALGLARAVERACKGRDERDFDPLRGWMAFGADPNAKVELPGSRQPKLSALERAFETTPGAWRVAALLAQAGAKADAASFWGAARQTMSCCVTEGSSRFRAEETPGRVAAFLAILGALGSTPESFRGKNGSRFDEFAMSCLWGNPSDSMAKALAETCGGWTERGKARLPALATQALRHREDADCLDALEAISVARGLGGWRAGWAEVAKAAKSAKASWGREADPLRKDERWGQAFGRWIAREGWGVEGVKAIEKAWPELAKAPAMRMAKEAAELGVASQDAPSARPPKPRAL